MVMNHLRTTHYHLGLVCALCIDFFSTNTDAMRWHAHMCKSNTSARDNDQEEDGYKNDDDGDKDDEYLPQEA